MVEETTTGEVDHAMPDSTNSSRSGAGTAEQVQQVEVLREELTRLKESVAAIASTVSELAAGSVEKTAADIEETLKSNVFVSVSVAALIGYVWGRTR